MFMIAETANHLTMQKFTSKADLSKYTTIERYRKSANNRIAFHSSLDALTQALILKIGRNLSVQEGIHMFLSLDTDTQNRQIVESGASVSASFGSGGVGQTSVLPDGK
jgi:hypothetical protein